MSETDSVKFTCEQTAMEIAEFDGFAKLNVYRRKLIELGVIGMNSDGIGFGNLSIREGASSRFYITGSGTGGIPELVPGDYARVVAYDFERNWLRCEGTRVASSESLTHAAVYQSEPRAGGVIHCHDMRLWAALLEEAPTAQKGIEYGTPEMAYAVRRLFDVTDVKERKIFVMAAHEGGLVTFGKDLAEAFGVLQGARSKELEARS